MDPRQPTDPELVASAAAGDARAFRSLVERHRTVLWGALRRRASSREDALEAFQEAWVRALERLASLRDPGSFRSWLLAVGFNFLRQKGRQARRTTELSEDVQCAAGGEVGDDLERAEELEQLRRHIRSLPPRQREVVELRLGADLSHAEIGACLGISEENARANFYQAVCSLRRRLASPDERAPATDAKP